MGLLIGKGKIVVPVRLENCTVHPRLEPIQYLDFSVRGSLPWSALIDRIREIEAEATSQEDLTAAANDEGPTVEDATVKAILAYLDQRGYQMVSYERIRQRISTELTDDSLDSIIQANPKLFRHALLKGVSAVLPSKFLRHHDDYATEEVKGPFSTWWIITRIKLAPSVRHRLTWRGRTT